MSPQLKSLYRRLLRELPAPGTTTTTAAVPKNSKPSHLSHPTPVKHRIRSTIQSTTTSTKKASEIHHIQVTEQFVQYLKAQRTYATLVERYNPGMNMNDGERVRLSARRIGMNLPVEFETERDGGEGKR
jgi:ATP synthase assembly factor FMC1